MHPCRHCYPVALAAVESGLIKIEELRGLITHRFNFHDETVKAFETAKTDKVNVIKAMLHF